MSDVDRLMLEFLDAWEARRAPGVEDLCAAHPECAAELRARIGDFLRMSRGLPSGGSAVPLAGRVLGDFRLLREIGRGGMGVVYEAEQISLRRRVALKLLAPHPSLDPATVDRFRREAATAAKLRHPGIVEIHSVGEADGIPFFAMEFVEGMSLDGVLEKMRSGAATWNRLHVELVARVADALEHAHRAGVIHRDVKPANILLRDDGAPVLTDFGLAREEGLPGLTRTGEFAGTPHYASPEQVMAGRAPIDARTDVFSLGVTLFELLTLKKPFEGESAQEIVARILTREPPSPRKLNGLLPRDLETIVLKAIEKEPARRYESAAAFASDLRAFLAYRPIAARPAGWTTRVTKLARRHRAASLTASAAGAALLASAVWWGFQPGYLTVTSPTAGATVFVDGVARGATPLEAIALAPGIHRVRLEKGAELFSEEQEVAVSRARVRSIERALSSYSGIVKLASDPSGASVRIVAADGRELPESPTAPADLELRAGTYRARFELPGFEAQEKEFEVRPAGQRTECSARWETGELRLTANCEGVRVEIARGDRPVRSVTLPLAAPLLLPAGVYSLRAELSEHLRLEREAIRIAAAARTNAHLSLNPVARLFSVMMPGPVYALVAADVDGDGLPEIVAGSKGGEVAAFDRFGRRKASHDLGAPVTALAVSSAAGVFGAATSGEIFRLGPGADLTRIATVRPANFIRLHAEDATLFVASESAGDVDLLGFDGAGTRRFVSSGPAFVRLLASPDLDGDGRAELVAARWRPGSVQAFRRDGSEIFTTRVSGKPSALVVASRGAGSPPDLVVGTDANKIECLRADGTPRWTVSADDWVKALLATDLDGDGSDEIVASSASGQLLFLAPDGRVTKEARAPSEVGEFALADLDGDGKPEIAAGTRGGHVVLFDARGERLAEADLGSAVRLLVSADLDGDGTPELVAGCDSGQVAALAIDRHRILEKPLPGFVQWLDPIPGAEPARLCAQARSGEAYGLEADGSVSFELPAIAGPWFHWFAAAKGADGRPLLFRNLSASDYGVQTLDGEVRWRERIEGNVTDNRAFDLDGEGRPELLVATREGKLIAISGDGGRRFSVDLGGSIEGLAFGDVDGDGSPEIVAAVRGQGYQRVTPRGERKTPLPISQALRRLVVVSAGRDHGLVGGTEEGSVLWFPGGRGEAKLLGSFLSPVAGVETCSLDAAGRPGIVACSRDGEVAVLTLEGERLFARDTASPLDRAVAFDLDGDGVPEVLAPTFKRNAVLGWKLNGSDPRRGERRRFLEALEAAEKGDEAAAESGFREAKLRWLALDATGIASIGSRLRLASGSASASRAATLLDRVRQSAVTR